MLRKLFLITGICLMLAACGTQAVPVYEEVDSHEADAIIAQANETATAIVAEALENAGLATEEASFGPVITGEETPEASDDDDMPVPTEELVVTEEAVETEEAIATEEAVATEEGDTASSDASDVDFEPVSAEDDPFAIFVSLANAGNGEALFNENFETATGTWMCSTCHNVDSLDVKIGPGLLDVAQHANLRVEGEGPYTYLFNSIKNSQEYIVPEFVGMAMMPDYNGVLSDAQIYDLVAYLMTLEKPE